MSADPSVALREGPWEHRMISANGTRIHAAVAGPDQADTPLVVLLHGYPQCWFAWRHQVDHLARAGYRVAALDLRGYGASDKPPGRYDVPVLADDVAAVIRSLGAQRATIAGHGLGGQVAWAMPSRNPGVVEAIAAFAAPHPARLTRVATRLVPLRTLGWLATIQIPWFPERSLTHGREAHRVLAAWSAPQWQCPDADFYATSMRMSFSAHSAMEQLRWLVRSSPRSDGRAYRRAVAAPVGVPVLAMHGGSDRLLPVQAFHGDHEFTAAGYERVLVEDAGHFLPEEAPEQTTAALLNWLERLHRDPTARRGGPP